MIKMLIVVTYAIRNHHRLPQPAVQQLQKQRTKIDRKISTFQQAKSLTTKPQKQLLKNICLNKLSRVILYSVRSDQSNG